MIARVLVALDGSERAPAVLAAAAEVARRFDAELVALRVIFVPAEFPPAGHVSHADPLPAHMREEAERELAALMAAEKDVRFGTMQVAHDAQPWRAILRMSDALAVDLVVIGSHGYHGVDRIVGTTAAKVVNLAHRNVLVVHARADASGASAPHGGVPESSR